MDINDGLKFFADCLNFEIGYDEIKSKNPSCVLEKGRLRINLFEKTTLTNEHYPEFRFAIKIFNKFTKKFQQLTLNFFIRTST